METIKIKETSHSGVIACVGGIYGKVTFGEFVPYTERELNSKTAYKDGCGWEEYASIEAYLEHRKTFNEERKAKNAELKELSENAHNEAWAKLSKLEVIPVTVNNLSTLLTELNNQNWGAWNLPKLSIGYSANQYDCDGRVATTIELKEPITDGERGIFNETRFVVGAPKGYLSKYQRL